VAAWGNSWHTNGSVTRSKLPSARPVSSAAAWCQAWIRLPLSRTRATASMAGERGAELATASDESIDLACHRGLERRTLTAQTGP
jgi:hypothetical protein